MTESVTNISGEIESSHPPDEKAKPFRLVKYFTFSSLIFVFIGALVLSVLNSHWARAMQLKKSEDFALLLVNNLNHQIFLQFYIPIVVTVGKVQLRDKQQSELMDKVVRSTLHSFDVDKVTIYDNKDNVVSYSFDQELIGKHDLGGAGYQKALAGETVSRVVQSGSLVEIMMGIPKGIEMITHAPLREELPRPGPSGRIIGVIEIVQNLSQDYKEIVRFQIRAVITSGVVMAALFLVLLIVVKRGETIIQRRAEERILLKEKLARAERLSSIGEMAAVISHEIRNPLGIIRSSSELLKKKMAAVDSKSPIPDIIVEEATRLNNIITDFFNFAKPRDLSFRSCRVSDVLEKNVAFISSQTAKENCVIHTQLDTQQPEIMADADALYQAFLNILINAMQAMPEGGDIFVRVLAETDGVTVIVEDTGPGVSRDLIHKIWDPFYTTKDKGTGLGLGIVKNIIDAHGGEVQIENRDPIGARVIVYLPVQGRK